MKKYFWARKVFPYSLSTPGTLYKTSLREYKPMLFAPLPCCNLLGTFLFRNTFHFLSSGTWLTRLSFLSKYCNQPEELQCSTGMTPYFSSISWFFLVTQSTTSIDMPHMPLLLYFQNNKLRHSTLPPWLPNFPAFSSNDNPIYRFVRQVIPKWDVQDDAVEYRTKTLELFYLYYFLCFIISVFAGYIK